MLQNSPLGSSSSIIANVIAGEKSTSALMVEHQKHDAHNLTVLLDPSSILTLDRASKGLYSSVLLLGLFVVIVLGGAHFSYNKYHMFGYLMAVILAIWNTAFFTVLFTCDHLHMIYIKRRPVNSKLLFIPVGYVEVEHRVASTVSDIHAIVGSNIERVALFTMYGTFCVTYCAVATKWSEAVNSDSNEQRDTLGAELICMMVAGLGIAMIATWQVEPHKMSKILHYLAAASTILGTPTAVLMQQRNGSMWCVILACATYIACIAWVIQRAKFIPNTHEDLQMVHRYSMISIVTEGIVLDMAYICGTLYIFNM